MIVIVNIIVVVFVLIVVVVAVVVVVGWRTDAERILNFGPLGGRVESAVRDAASRQ
jgi:hypothetical protein